MGQDLKKKKPPYSGRLTIGAAIMVALGLFWLRFLPQYPMEIALVISIAIFAVLLKDYWYRRQLPSV
jgi:hypothetical protein